MHSLTDQVPSYHDPPGYDSSSIEHLNSFLPQNSTLVEYVKYQVSPIDSDSIFDCYLALVMNSGGGLDVVDLGDAESIDSLVNCYRRHMAECAQLTTPIDEQFMDNYRKIGQSLYTRIWKPLKTYLGQNGIAFVAPDCGLNLVSFATLMPDSNRYLIEDYKFHYLLTGRDILRLKTIQPAGQGLLAIGCPDFKNNLPENHADSKNTTRGVLDDCLNLNALSLRPLPGTEIEINQVVNEWKAQSDEAVTLLTSAQASEKNFKSNSVGKRIIHVATHGFYLENVCQDVLENDITLQKYYSQNPLLSSGLFFAEAGKKESDGEDGILTAYEISSLNLFGTDLMVMSACETGLGKVSEGEGIYGLRRSVQLAGVKTIVISLWQIPDNSTGYIMKNLYSSLGTDYTDIMTDICRKMLKKLRRKGSVDHPYTWGSFIAIGDWRY